MAVTTTIKIGRMVIATGSFPRYRLAKALRQTFEVWRRDRSKVVKLYADGHMGNGPQLVGTFGEKLTKAKKNWLHGREANGRKNIFRKDTTAVAVGSGGCRSLPATPGQHDHLHTIQMVRVSNKTKKHYFTIDEALLDYLTRPLTAPQLKDRIEKLNRTPAEVSKLLKISPGLLQGALDGKYELDLCKYRFLEDLDPYIPPAPKPPKPTPLERKIKQLETKMAKQRLRGAELKRIRERLGLSQEFFAQSLSVALTLIKTAERPSNLTKQIPKALQTAIDGGKVHAEKAYQVGALFLTPDTFPSAISTTLYRIKYLTKRLDEKLSPTQHFIVERRLTKEERQLTQLVSLGHLKGVCAKLDGKSVRRIKARRKRVVKILRKARAEDWDQRGPQQCYGAWRAGLKPPVASPPKYKKPLRAKTRAQFLREKEARRLEIREARLERECLKREAKKAR